MLAHDSLMGVSTLHTFQLVKVCLFLYADPGSGTLIWQLLVAAFLGLMFYARFFVHKIRNAFSSKKIGTQSPEILTSEEYERDKPE